MSKRKEQKIQMANVFMECFSHLKQKSINYIDLSLLSYGTIRFQGLIHQPFQGYEEMTMLIYGTTINIKETHTLGRSSL